MFNGYEAEVASCTRPGSGQGLLMDRVNALARRVPTWVVYGLGLVPLASLSGGRSSAALVLIR